MEIIFIIFIVGVILILFSTAGIAGLFINDQKKFFNNVLEKVQTIASSGTIKNIKKKISFKTKYKDVGLPVISVKILDNRYDFILDTGASFNALDKSEFERIVKENNLDVDVSKLLSDSSSDTVVTGVGGTQSNIKDIKVKLEIDEQEFEETFSLVDIKPGLESYGKGLYQLSGVIGSEFFERNKWKLDFDELVLWTNQDE